MERPALVGAAELAHRSGRPVYTVLLAVKASPHLQHMRRWADAARMLELGLSFAVELGTGHEAMVRSELADALSYLKREQESLEHLTRAVQISQELGDRRLEGRLRGSLGRMYNKLGDTTKAVENYHIALEIATEAGDVQQQGGIRVAIGAVLTDAGDIHGAVHTYHRALHLAHQTGSPRGIAPIHQLLGGLYMEQLGRNDLALDHYKEARQIYEDIGDHYSEADIWYRIGWIGLHDGSPEDAHGAWKIAMLLAKRVGYDDLVEHMESMFTENGLTQDAPSDDWSRLCRLWSRKQTAARAAEQ